MSKKPKSFFKVGHYLYQALNPFLYQSPYENLPQITENLYSIRIDCMQCQVSCAKQVAFTLYEHRVLTFVNENQVFVQPFAFLTVLFSPMTSFSYLLSLFSLGMSYNSTFYAAISLCKIDFLFTGPTNL